MTGNKFVPVVLGFALFASVAQAGGGGLVVKGASHLWDDAAGVAVKAGGRSLVKGAGHVALKAGAGVARLGAESSGLLARGTALAERHGGARAVRALAELPAEDVPRVVGALERNPGVAKEFLDALARGGKDFVDRIFKVNHKQILAGTLGAAAIYGVARGADIVEQLPVVVNGKNLHDEHVTALEIFRNTGSAKDRLAFANNVVGNTQRRADGQLYGGFGLGALTLLLLGLLAFVWLRGRAPSRA